MKAFQGTSGTEGPRTFTHITLAPHLGNNEPLLQAAVNYKLTLDTSPLSLQSISSASFPFLEYNVKERFKVVASTVLK